MSEPVTVVKFGVTFKNNLEEHYICGGKLPDKIGDKKMSFEVILSDGTWFHGDNVMLDPDDPNSNWGVGKISEKKYGN